MATDSIFSFVTGRVVILAGAAWWLMSQIWTVPLRVPAANVRPSGVRTPAPEKGDEPATLISGGPIRAGWSGSVRFHTDSVLSPTPGVIPSLFPLASQLTLNTVSRAPT